jgi:RNase H-like domain found in reverse transcriptase/Reverse transcriptase (RNA-dependent DNA polymerase)/Integrase zinc binding domain/Integrase core domain
VDCQHILPFTIGGGSVTEFMVDSGADANIVSEHDFKGIKQGFDEGSKVLFDVNFAPLVNISGYAAASQLKVVCSFKAWVEVVVDPDAAKKPRTFTEFFVVRGGGRSLMGRASSRTMKILQVGMEVNSVAMEEDSPDEFPSMPGVMIDFDIIEGIRGVHRPYINIPAHFHDSAIKRIDEMIRQKIIEMVPVPGEWMSGLLAVPKGKGDMRLVVNMSAPNKAIRRCVHPMPKFEEMQLKLHGKKFFAKLDLSSAFFHMKLTPRSSAMTQFKAPSTSGTKTFQFLRMVFGVNCAPEIFQREMERILEGIPGIVIYIDDVLVAGETMEEYEATLKLVLARLHDNNLSLNEEKCEYAKEKITFLGHQVSAEGFNIDEQKVSDINVFRAPRNSTELKSFLGLSNFVRGFIKNFSDLTKPLRDVDGKDKFRWGLEQERAFRNVKEKIADCTVSQGFFSTKDKTELFTDASPYAIGAVLTQVNSKGKRRIISFASKSLTETERRYPQVQRESLAIVWAVEHFHYYLLGAHFTIKTDADGVRFIFDRDNQKPKRFLRRSEGWAMRLNTFNYDIVFVKGIDNIADPSSRLFQSGEKAIEFGSGEMPCEIARISFSTVNDIEYGRGHMPIHEVKMETATCRELQMVIEALETRRWPRALHLYKIFREELEVSDGVVIRQGLIVPPVSLRAKAIDIAHSGHQGMSKTKSVLKEVMWWPRMYRGVEDWVAGCRMCLLKGRAEDDVPMQRTTLPSAPWEYVAMDYCGPFASFGGVHVVCIVDYHSRYLTAAIVRSTGWKHLEPVFNEIFGRLGFPKTIKSDNGAPFSGQQYKQYCDSNGIERVFSFPLDPKQNGMAEAAMKHVNSAAQHASVEGTSLATALKERVRAHNDSEHSETKVVPSQVIYGRRLRRNLPTVKPPIVAIDIEAMREQDKSSKLKKKSTEDQRRHAKNTSIKVGDKVLLLRPDRCKGQTRFGLTEWTVTDIRMGDLTLLSPEGKETRRNITKVRKIPPPIDQSSFAAVQNSPTRWPTQQEMERPPSPFLTATNWANTPAPLMMKSPELGRDTQIQWPTQQEMERPPSPFLITAGTETPARGSAIPTQNGTASQHTSARPTVTAPTRPKRMTKQPERLKDCFLYEVRDAETE